MSLMSLYPIRMIGILVDLEEVFDMDLRLTQPIA